MRQGRGWTFAGLACALLLTAPASAAETVRHALLVTANDGGAGRAPLVWANADGERLSAVLESLGGVPAQDQVRVPNATRADVLAAFDTVTERLRAAGEAGHRTEILFFYSGHADEEGLLLGEERLSFPELRARLDGLPADVRVAVVDSCASGTLVRGKGGIRQPPFLQDIASDVRGHAYVTSSSRDEQAQESDRVRGSFFTHYLVSALRGAGDDDGDGRVTLEEAYGFAYDETLRRTERTQIGPQHPSYEIQLAGQGDLVLTRLQRADAGLALSEELAGRVLVRGADGVLVAELDKRAGRAAQLGVGAGRYDVTLRAGDEVLTAAVDVPSGQLVALAPPDFGRVEGEVTRPRGVPPEALVDEGTDDEGLNDEAVDDEGTDPEAVADASEPLTFVPVNLGVAPFLSVNDAVSGRTLNLLSLGLPWSQGARVHGANVSLFGGLVTEELIGVQAAVLANVAVGRVIGGQVSALTNVAVADVVGAQVAPGANVTIGDHDVLQLAAAANFTSGRLRGAQIAAAANYVTELEGAQIAVLNIAAQTEGAQIGLVNIAGRARGAQIGLLNLALEMEGVSFGLLNLILDGYNHVGVYASELAPANVFLTLGSRYIYTLLSVGAQPVDGVFDGDRYSVLQIGLGGHIPLDGLVEDLFVDVDVSGFDKWPQSDPRRRPRNLGTQLRATVGWQPLPYFGVFGGLSASMAIADGDPAETVGFVPVAFLEDDPFFTVWPGAFAGVRL